MNLGFKEGAVNGKIVVSEKMKADFIWNDKKLKLNSGTNNIKL